MNEILTENGIDDRLAYHIGTLFRRAPIPVYEKELMFPCYKETCKKSKEKSKEDKELTKKVPTPSPPDSEIEEEIVKAHIDALNAQFKIDSNDLKTPQKSVETSKEEPKEESK